jgi:ubiquitin C-terminal hydrolase
MLVFDIGGHYVAFLRLDGGWFRMSDSWVTLVDEAAVLKAQAFLLFYERLDGDMHMV